MKYFRNNVFINLQTKPIFFFSFIELQRGGAFSGQLLDDFARSGIFDTVP